ncbi:hypothetical protein MKZ38_001947 [Zalerion maritima]|uniref:Histone deacetylase n=1 Tax=Zalerion maritima TaxID=339359 RepID=A0AAD5RPN8_9PEZI|nr:hypothetical protein MKZ38_001947 [Zalerion maritima]
MPSATMMDANGTDVHMDGEDHPMQDANGYVALSAANLNTGPESNSASADYEAGFETDSDEEDDDDEYVKDILIEQRDRRILPTGVCYDDRMKLHANADWSPDKHHPEDPQRIEAIFNTFKRAGLVFNGPDAELRKLYETNPTKYMWRIDCRKATRAEVTAVHTESQFDWAEALKDKSTDELRELTRQMDQGRASLYVGGMTFEAALLSAGGAIETCINVVEGNVKNAFAVIRPPGHHAEFDESMGFCIFNNVPVATKVCRSRFPDTCRKVLILDWDVHHGNGVQNIFYSDPNVLYISLHVYNNGQFYPGQPENDKVPDGGIDNVGRDEGVGKNVNIGWHDQGMGNGEYMAAFQQIVMPIAKEFCPDLVVISAGFDAADGDELGGCFVTPTCYAHMTHMLMSLANGKVAVCLEGGYNLHAISASALEVARTLMGEPPPQFEIPKINKQAAQVLKQVQSRHAPYWECMRPGVVDVQDQMMHGGQRLQDVFRLAQRQQLSDRFGMTPLYLSKNDLHKKMENQVLVTRDFSSSSRLMIIIHDPPEFRGQPDPIDSRIEPHNSFMTDPVPRYIDWSINQGFAVMDINVPHYEAKSDDFDATVPRQDAETLQANIRDLMIYLWDNFIQIMPAREIFLMGVGDAYLGVKVLLINRGMSSAVATYSEAGPANSKSCSLSKDCKDRISGILNFVTGVLRPIKSDTDPQLSSWYKDNSLVLVDSAHACWSDQALVKKVSKRRFGSVTKSDVSGLANMMDFHLPDVEAWIMQRVGEITLSKRSVASPNMAGVSGGGYGGSPAPSMGSLGGGRSMGVPQQHMGPQQGFQHQPPGGYSGPGPY